MNEAKSLRYIRHHTNIPVPTVYCDFEDDDACYSITGYVEGVDMFSLNEDQKAVRSSVRGATQPSRNPHGSQVQSTWWTIRDCDAPLSSSTAHRN
ncbi:hypothetical protein N656DRAFT_779544 [Canariomyces notabilis]|uniref:Uncharacterized protein n=1 Tax=Canariomyces notabilis TaxID=2074819 RepID=A0AAN6YRB9_9PEZI|nr:hypothetical protein N656DRAFT_779544 [Canariomyces arenarius]